MTNEKLQLIKRTDTAMNVLKYFLGRERIGPESSLETLRLFLGRQGYTIRADEFYALFKELEDAGAGRLVEYGGKASGKFIWAYSLKDVADQILHPNKMVPLKLLIETDHRGTRGRPKGYSPKKLVIRPLERHVLPKESPDVLIMFVAENGKYLPMKLKEAEKIADQVRIIKSQLG